MADPSQPGVAAGISTVVVDASVWASRLLLNDSNHARAKGWIDSHIAAGGFFVAPQLFVLEVASAVRRQSGQASDARLAVDSLYALSILRLVPLDQDIIDGSVELAVEYGLRGADATYVAVARRLGLALVTFDRYQLKQPPDLVQTVRP